MSKLIKSFAIGLGASLLSSTAMAANYTNYEYGFNMTQIGVNPTLHNDGFTGQGVIVGVFDGIADLDHYDLNDLGHVTLARDANGNLIYSGTFTKDGPHGTFVAGVIGAERNEQGVAGVAPGATIISYGVFDDNGWRAFDLGKKALDHARINNVKVVNMSYGPSVGGGDVFLNGELDLFKNYGTDDANGNGGMVLVRAAGNDGKAAKFESYIGDASNTLGHILIVGSVDKNNKISYFSNRAGSNCIGPVNSCDSSDKISNFFIVAYGRNIISDYPDNSLAQGSGTSFSAPAVAGAVALLESEWAFLTPVQEASIIKQTATDLGGQGVDSIYGHGLLNVDKAMHPIGGTYVATGSTVGQGGTSLSSSGFTGASTLPANRSASSALDGLVVFDDFGRDFETDIPEPTAAEPSRNIDDRLSELSLAMTMGPSAGPQAAGTTLGFQASGDEPSQEGFTVTSFAGDGFDLKLGQGSAGLYFQASDAGTAGGKAPSLGRHMMLGLSEAGEAFNQGSFADATLALSEDISVGAFYASSSALMPAEAESGLAAALSQDASQPDSDMVGFQTSYKVSEGITLGVNYGRLVEQDQFLGATTTGAFALGESTTTQTYGASLSLALTDKLSAVMFYDYATVDAPAASGSLYQGVEGWGGQKFGATLALNGPITGTDVLSFTLMQPLHVSSGEGTAKVPVGRDFEGNVIYELRDYSVDSSAMPVELALSYVDRGETVSKGLTFAIDDADARDSQGVNFSAVAAFKVKF